MKKGKLIYENPKNDRIRVYLSFLLMGFVCFLAISILYNVAKNEFYSEDYSPLTYRFLLIFYVFIILLGGILATTVILIPRFKIYESGITRVLSPIHIFRKEGDFIPYEKIKAYTKYKFRNGYRCKVYFDGKFVIYTDTRKKVTNTLVENLKRHEIKQMPDNCPNCNNKLYAYTEKCSQCGQKIFQEKR